MGNIIGILSTVILVSTLATLIFAVGAYIMARKRRRGGDADEVGADTTIPENTAPLTGLPDQPADLPEAPPVRSPDPVPPPPEKRPATVKPVFRRLTPQGGEQPVATDVSNVSSGWDWE